MDHMRHTTLEELENTIKHLKIRKAPGLDGTSNKTVQRELKS